MAGLILWLYRLLMLAALGPACLILRRQPNFKGTLLARCGLKLPDVPVGRQLIWVHAASVGEVKAVSGLITALKSSRPEAWLLVTAMTVTGREVAEQVVGVDQVEALPFDLAFVMRRFVAHVNPSLLVVAETEIWPEMLLAAAAANVAVVFANARMTERSYRSYARLGRFMKFVLRKVGVMAISEADGERFALLGAGKVEVLGNLKLDGLRDLDVDKCARLRGDLLRPGAKVFVAGSVREGEEQLVVRAIALASGMVDGLVSIVAPRHAGSVRLIEDLCSANGLSCCLRSCADKSANVIIVDTVGELASLYGLADAAFVGGSLIDLGGQNILEAVAWGVPVLHGRFMSNFEWALAVVSPHTIIVEPDFGDCLVDVITKPQAYRERAEMAQMALATARGATDRYLARITELL